MSLPVERLHERLFKGERCAKVLTLLRTSELEVQVQSLALHQMVHRVIELFIKLLVRELQAMVVDFWGGLEVQRSCLNFGAIPKPQAPHGVDFLEFGIERSCVEEVAVDLVTDFEGELVEKRGLD